VLILNSFEGKYSFFSRTVAKLLSQTRNQVERVVVFHSLPLTMSLNRPLACLARFSFSNSCRCSPCIMMTEWVTGRRLMSGCNWLFISFSTPASLHQGPSMTIDWHCSDTHDCTTLATHAVAVRQRWCDFLVKPMGGNTGKLLANEGGAWEMIHTI